MPHSALKITFKMAIKKGSQMPQRTTRRAALLLISHLAFIKFDFIIVAVVVARDVAMVGGGDVAAVDCRTAHG